ncbi:MAG TPA: glycoside hydrolase family 11 protein [Polyangiaceae bacterium]
MRTNLLWISISSVVLGIGIVNCSSTTDESAGSGGGSGTGASGASHSAGSNAGGAAATGNAGSGTAGNSTAGSSTGGNPANGGTASGGAATGGTASGGAAAGGKGGGVGTGGSANGGAATGGKGGGGAANGGAGGAAAGGTGGGTSAACSVTTPRTGGTQYCSNSIGNVNNGYSYQLWSNGTGSGCMTPYGSDAAFKANWNNSSDFLARVGKGWNETQTYDQLGTISSDFAYTKTGSGGGFSFIGIYGWSNNPLIEFYIVEDWYGSGPPTGGGTKKGSFSVDGGTYNIYQHTQNNQPSIHGNATFPQFFSVRQTPRQCGHISITEHFKEWASLGLTLGKMEEARLLVEVGGGVGSIDFTTATITVK